MYVQFSCPQVVPRDRGLADISGKVFLRAYAHRRLLTQGHSLIVPRAIITFSCCFDASRIFMFPMTIMLQDHRIATTKQLPLYNAPLFDVGPSAALKDQTPINVPNRIGGNSTSTRSGRKRVGLCDEAGDD